MIDKSTGRIEYAIMSFGGVLGVGIAITRSLEALSYDEARGGYVANVDRSRLEGAPA
jgi:hypothetical protein